VVHGLLRGVQSGPVAGPDDETDRHSSDEIATMRILLTGGTGFVGSHVVRALSDGHEISVTVRRPDSAWRLASIGHQLRMIPVGDAAARLEGGEFDIMVHIATNYGRAGCLSDVVHANILLPLVLLEAASRGRVLAFINTSTFSGGQYNAYGLSKAHFSDWCRHVAECGATPIVDLELQHPIGAMDSPGKFAVDLARKILANEVCELTPGEQKRDFVDVRDVAEAFRCVVDAVPAGRRGYTRVEVGRGVAVSIREFAETLRCVAGSRSTLCFGALAYRTGERMCSVAQTEALRAMGWQWRYELADMANELVKYERSLDVGK
jgi:nucleoside-diphosphate-sugar epimerase